MKTVLYAYTLGCVLKIAHSIPVMVSDSEWGEFKLKFGKVYESDAMEKLRKFIYSDNKDKILAHNELHAKGFTTYSKAVNQFADLLPSEFVAQYLRFKTDVPRHSSLLDIHTPTGKHPDSVDWRKNQGTKIVAVTKVKDQGACGSCWAFSSTGSIEGQVAIKLGKLVELSVEQLVDCAYSDGCNGGSVAEAFNYIQGAGGIDYESQYPYKSEKGHSSQCRFNKTEAKVKVNGYEFVTQDETSLEVAVANVGPISIAIDAEGIMHYDRGVYDNPDCSHTANHAVLVVGYGTAGSGIPFWIVKNSWGSSWGDGGYISMRRNKNNQCAIASNGIYPLIETKQKKESKTKKN